MNTSPQPRISTPLMLILALALFCPAANAAPWINLDRPNEWLEWMRNGFRGYGQKLETIGHVGAADGVPMAHGNLVMHQGKLAMVFAPDSGGGGGGFAFLDVDFSNPNSPKVKLAHQVIGQKIREGHGFGFHFHREHQYAVLQSTDGVQIWDWADINKPVLVKDIVLPEIVASDYIAGAWWAFWQAPYIYVGGSSNGLYIIDAHDPANAKLVNRVSAAALRLDRVAPTFAVGNLLVVTTNQGRGISTADISDPVHPRWLDHDHTAAIYSTMFNGGNVYVAGLFNTLSVLSVANNGLIEAQGYTSMGGRGGYCTVQDTFAHCGASGQYIKVDVSDPKHPKPIAHGSSDIPHRDEDFGTAIGPYALIGDDHGNGSYWVRHQKEDDTTPPEVNMVNPANGADRMALTSRVGFTFTDALDLRTVNSSSIIVRPASGGAPLEGFYSSQMGIVNFSPAKPLEPNTKYVVEVVAGGVKDYFGNATKGFKSEFTTGDGSAVPELKLDASSTAVVPGEPVLLKSAAPKAGESIQWDFGDGRQTGGMRGHSATSVSYSKPGHYLVTVRIKSKERLNSGSVAITVRNPLTREKPSQSSTLALDSSLHRLYNVNPDNDSVTATDSNTLLVHWERAVGKDPKSLVLDPSGRIWVAVAEEDSVVVLDSSGTILRQVKFPFGFSPTGIAFNRADNSAYVTSPSGGALWSVNAASFAIEKKIKLNGNPKGISISGDGSYALISRFTSPDEQGEVFKVDLRSQSASMISLAHDPGPDTEASGRGLPNYLGAPAISPDGLSAWVPSKKDNILRGTSRDGKALSFENSVRAILSKIDLQESKEELKARVDFNDRDAPVAATYSPLGDYIYVSLQGSNTVNVVDAYSHEDVSAVEDLGRAPQGLILSEDGKRLYVHSFLTREIIAFHMPDLLHFRRVGSAKVVKEDKLPPPVLLGKQIFYNAKDRRMSRDGYISCASCHNDGGQDGRVWDFTDRGEGFRNTTTLRGKGGTGHGPLHWTANFDEIQDFENDIRNAFEGRGFLSDSDWLETKDSLGAKKAGKSKELDALAAYVTSLANTDRSPFRKGDGNLTSMAMEGEKVFQRLNCQTCHAGQNYTDSGKGGLHDVGTIKTTSGKRRGEALTGFDTPTLLGIWNTSPYLHDGSAKTVGDVLSASAGAHSVSKLTEDEKKQLLRFLLER